MNKNPKYYVTFLILVLIIWCSVAYIINCENYLNVSGILVCIIARILAEKITNT